MLTELLENRVLVGKLIRGAGKEVEGVLQGDGFAVGRTSFAHVDGTLVVVEGVAVGGKSPDVGAVDDNASPVGRDVEADRDCSPVKSRIGSVRMNVNGVIGKS